MYLFASFIVVMSSYFNSNMYIGCMGYSLACSAITLLKIIKGTRVRNGITDLPYILCMMCAC